MKLKKICWFTRTGKIMVLISFFLLVGALPTLSQELIHYPGSTWDIKSASELGIDSNLLTNFINYVLKGNTTGIFISRYGYQVDLTGFTTNDNKKYNVASACKPTFNHFLFKAIEDKLITSLDEKVVENKILSQKNDWPPRLKNIISFLKGTKDKNITWRHFANQTSCYGVMESPGTVFNYNDYQIALFWDLLFLGVYGATETNVDNILHNKLTIPIGCENAPSYLNTNAPTDTLGRLKISPRDFARFGLLYMNNGMWKNTLLLKETNVNKILTERISLEPRSAYFSTLNNWWNTPNGKKCDFNNCPNTKLVDPKDIKDNCPTFPTNLVVDVFDIDRSLGEPTLCARDIQANDANYGWLWWKNGRDINNQKCWPAAPDKTYACLGHGGKEAMIIIPEKNLIVSYADSDIPNNNKTTAVALQKLLAAVKQNILITFPNGGETLAIDSTKTIKWDSTGLTGYVTIDLYKNRIFSRNIGTALASAGAYSWKIPTDLATGNDYLIKIYQNYIADISDGNFSIAYLPVKPELKSPANNATLCTLTPTFTWYPVIASPAVDYYELWIKYNGELLRSYSEIKLPSFTVPKSDQLESGKTYAWYVRAHNSVGFSTWSGRIFNISAMSVPAKPTLISPANNATVATTTPTFTWNAVTACPPVDYYELWIKYNGVLLHSYTDIPKTSKTVPATDQLQKGKTYTWFVRGHNSKGGGYWSGRTLKIGDTIQPK